jgi:hypothetical protein
MTPPDRATKLLITAFGTPPKRFDRAAQSTAAAAVAVQRGPKNRLFAAHRFDICRKRQNLEQTVPIVFPFSKLALAIHIMI